jgi:hypothetical protein
VTELWDRVLERRGVDADPGATGATGGDGGEVEADPSAEPG